MSFRHCYHGERIKGLCGAKPPQKPGWTDAVVLGGWLDGPEPWEPGAGERYHGVSQVRILDGFFTQHV